LLTNNWSTLERDGNSLQALPTGLQNFDGIPWDVRGLIVLDGLRQRRELPIFPTRVENIQIRRHVRRAHFLCAASWGASPNEEIGRWVFHTAEGATHYRPIQLGADLLDWWNPPGFSLPPGMNIAWTGANPRSAQANWGIRLFRVTWDNPQPDVEIQTLDFVSSMAGANPFLVAITLE
jgi:hypothetical protein